MVPGLLILYYEHSGMQCCVVRSLQMNVHQACAVHMPGFQRRCPFPSRSRLRNRYVRMVWESNGAEAGAWRRETGVGGEC